MIKTKSKFKQTEIGIIPEDWRCEPLGKHCTLFVPMRNRPKEFGGNIPWLRIEDLDGKFVSDTKSEQYVTPETVRKMNLRVCPPGTVLCSCTATIGICAITKKKLTTNQQLIGIYPNLEINNEFLYYYLLTQTNNLIRLGSGSITLYISRKKFEEFPIILPSPHEQQSIVKIVSDLDSKLELNQQMNRTLEAIGKAIFNHWFIDFEFPNEEGGPYKGSGGKMVYNEELGKEIPEGWRVGKLGELLNNTKTSLKRGEHLRDRKYVPIDNLPMKKIGLESFRDYKEAKSSLIAFEKNDILLGAMRVYFHRVNLAPFAGITRTTTFVLRPKKKDYLSFSLFLLNQDATINYANSHSKGSTIPYAVWEGSLSDMDILIPDEIIMQKFNDLLSPLLEKIRDTIYEQITLSQIRDSLLPKLMSGKIRVPVRVR